MQSSLGSWCQLLCTRIVSNAFPKAGIAVRVCKIQTRRRHRQDCVTSESSGSSMGILHVDMEKILYDQDAIAEAVAKLGE